MDAIKGFVNLLAVLALVGLVCGGYFFVKAVIWLSDHIYLQLQ